jgi:hypothetical protein
LMSARDASNVTGALLPDRTARVFKKPIANPQFDEFEFLVDTAEIPHATIWEG